MQYAASVQDNFENCILTSRSPKPPRAEDGNYYETFHPPTHRRDTDAGMGLKGQK